MIDPSSITFNQMTSEAIHGRFYNLAGTSWNSIGWLEKFARHVFGFIFPCMVDSVQKSCLIRSWKAVEQMDTLPADILMRINAIFSDCLTPTSYLHRYSSIISRIYCKSLGPSAKTIVIDKPNPERIFQISFDQRMTYIAANKAWGIIHFTTPEGVHVASNAFDNLADNTRANLAISKLARNYRGISCEMVLLSSNEQLLANIETTTHKATLVFREPHTNQILAVGNLINRSYLRWNITLVDQKKLDHWKTPHLLIAYAVLKFSQHYHFLSVNDEPYAI